MGNCCIRHHGSVAALQDLGWCSVAVVNDEIEDLWQNEVRAPELP